MKKTISFILVVIMCLALAACSNSRPDDGVKEIAPQASQKLAQHILGAGISSLCRLGKPLHRSCGILLDRLHQLQHFPPHLPHQLISGIRLLFVVMEHFVAENIVGELGLDLTDALFGEVGLSRLYGPGHHVDVRVLALVVKGGVPAEVTGRYLRGYVV